VVTLVLKILGNPNKTFEVHNHHNFAWKEEHFGEKYWVVRKGCTPAFPNQLGFIGSNMANDSVIVQGVDSELSKEALYSTVHGAGRTMSRNEAAGKKKWIKDRDGIKRPVVVGRGKVNFEKVKRDVREKGIELRGSGADEAPECYKNLDDVLHYMGNTIKVMYRLHPIGVAMAGSDIYDPYKD
jgi:tRNA-splicing ligase RtcB